MAAGIKRIIRITTENRLPIFLIGLITIITACNSTGKVPGDELIQVPLRWCAVEGSSAADDPAAVGETATDGVLWRRHERVSDNIWIPSARITFRSAMIANVRNQANFPIIPDPIPPSQGGPGEEGDVVIVNLASAPEINEVVADCEDAWDQLEQQVGSNIEGVIVVNVRKIVAPSGTNSPIQGVQFFGISSLRCFEFSQLGQQVCLDPLTYPSNAGAAVVLNDNVNRVQFDTHDLTLAHELGHALFLGHGNGLDDDNDGKVDQCCDADEDQEALPHSLMCPSCSSEVITAYQRETARTMALQTPGAVIDPPAQLKPAYVFSDQRVDQRHDTKQPGLDFVWSGMGENWKTGFSIFTHKLFGLLPKDASYRYLLYVDLDNDEMTGASPRELGYSTALKGVSVIVDVRVKEPTKGVEHNVETDLYVASNGEWTRQSDKAISFVAAAVEAETGTRLFHSVNTIVDTKSIGKAGHKVAIRAESYDMNDELSDVLPNEGDRTILRIKPPEYAICAVEPVQAKAGETVVMEAFDLIPNEHAHVLLGDKQVAEGKIDAEGVAKIKFRIPLKAKSGVRLVTVGAGKTAITADCAVEVIE